MRKSITRAAAIAAGACALAITAAAVAPAATSATVPTYYTVSRQVQVVPPGAGGLGVGCKKGGIATGGGYEIFPGGLPPGTFTVMQSSPPNGNVPATAWLVSVNTTANLTVTSYVNCVHY